MAYTFVLNYVIPWLDLPRVRAKSVKLSPCANKSSELNDKVASKKPKFSLILYDANATIAWTT